MIKNLMLICMLVLSISCSRSKTVSNEANVENLELSEAEEFDDVMLEGIDPDKRVALDSKSDSGLVIEGQDFSDESQDPALKGIEQFSESSLVDQYETYKVRKNETLMLISYKLYGDYGRWRELQELNHSRLKNVNKLTSGMKIRYSTRGAGFDSTASGSPYLIKRNDNLSKISSKVYGNSNNWRPIWRNNKRMIPNPNRIFTGFTLYYPNL